MAWQLIGAASVTATSRRVVVGPIEAPALGPLRLKVSAPVSVPQPHGRGLLAFESSHGRELGAVRVWPRPVPSCHLLGEGLEVRDPSGVLVFDPQGWNRRWLLAGFVLTVLVLADLPRPEWGETVPAPGLASPEGADLFLSPAGPAGRITFPR